MRERTKVRIEGELTLKEIADAEGVSPERIRQIEAKALAKVRWAFKKQLNITSLAEVQHVPPTREGTRYILPKKNLEQLEEYVPKFWPQVI